MSRKFSQVDVLGTTMGRHGRIHITSDEGKLWVGGRAEVVLSGSAAL